MLRNEKFNEKCDVFSMGVVLWELITRKEPYAKMAPLQVIAAVVFQGQRLPQPTGCHPRLCDLIDRCWAPESETRPSFFAVQELLQGVFEDLVRGHAAGQQRRTVSIYRCKHALQQQRVVCSALRARSIAVLCFLLRNQPSALKSEAPVYLLSSDGGLGCAGDWEWELRGRPLRCLCAH